MPTPKAMLEKVEADLTGMAFSFGLAAAFRHPDGSASRGHLLGMTQAIEGAARKMAPKANEAEIAGLMARFADKIEAAYRDILAGGTFDFSLMKD